ncbi:MAG: mandelate racemase/muconate lactonizing enzyme family protein [Methylobacteriaceae bacterium]|nr:mandelate racemase/muconate lactonizing enzyme family protein [Methylobacteriaceae bacterium]MBV9245884.1 mandelate racemase/muconate lactonizing enzyme family protein [Methylobacteriaceae bacterium]MBV9636354.1 mandelate racemase/muconate lactonizing enzyme family protein [Methylobacteriaceae bacterium]
MQIARIEVFQVDLPLREGSYSWSGNKSIRTYDSTVVRIATDTGLAGFGETCPLGPAYLPAHAAGARAGLAELAPHLIGQDPRELGVVNRLMERHLKGHPYVKSAIDMACWDLLGLAADMPVVTLLGGRHGTSLPLYRAISQDNPQRMAQSVAAFRAEGYRRFQIKVGGDPDVDIVRIRTVAAGLEAGEVLVADANTGWLAHQAARVLRAIDDIDLYVEQPCATYEACLNIRRRTRLPMVLDEVIDGVGMLLRAHADQAMDVVNIKLGKVGGITAARQLRDLCVSMGIAMTIEDSGGGDIVTAAIAHLAQSTPQASLFSVSDCNSYVTTELAEGAPRRIEGQMSAPTAPGLGVKPRPDVLGKPVFTTA